MSQTRVADAITEDFETGTWELYVSRPGNRHDKNGHVKGSVKKLHCHAAVMCCIAKTMRSYPEYRRVFVERSFDDLLHAIHACVSGNWRGAFFFLRSYVENVWCHLYYSNHPLEFTWLVNENARLSIEELRQHSERLLKDFPGFPRSFVRVMSDSYADLCRHAHSQSDKKRSIAWNLTEIGCSEERAKSISGYAADITTEFVICLSHMHPKVFSSLNPEWRALIRKVAGAKRRHLAMSPI